FFFTSSRRHTSFSRDWSSDVCSSDLSARRLPVGLQKLTLLYHTVGLGVKLLAEEAELDRLPLGLGPNPEPVTVGVASHGGEEAFGGDSVLLDRFEGPDRSVGPGVPVVLVAPHGEVVQSDGHVFLLTSEELSLPFRESNNDEGQYIPRESGEKMCDLPHEVTVHHRAESHDGRR